MLKLISKLCELDAISTLLQGFGAHFNVGQNCPRKENKVGEL